MCDTLAVVGSGGLLFAKNSDRPPDEAQFVAWHPARGAGRATVRTQYLDLPDAPAAAFLGSRPTWLWGVEHGVNEHGVAIGNEKLYTTRRPKDRPPALLGMDLVRLGLERGRSADDAVDVITDLVERLGQGGSGEEHAFAPYDSSFLVADAGGGWIVETCDRTWAARPIGAGASVSNRIALDTGWTRASADVAPGADFGAFRHPRIPTTIADHRLEATAACVARGADALGPPALVATLRDHGTGPWGHPGSPDAVLPPSEVGADHRGVTVCMHLPGVQATTASMIVAVPPTDVGSVRVWAALGNPCVSAYVAVPFGGPVPEVLASAASWRRFAALRDRVDGDPGALAAVRAALAPLEPDLLASPTPPLDALDAALTNLGV